MIWALLIILILIILQVSLNGWREKRNRSTYRRRDYHDDGKQ